jgi:hypothetical protein
MTCELKRYVWAWNWAILFCLTALASHPVSLDGAFWSASFAEGTGGEPAGWHAGGSDSEMARWNQREGRLQLFDDRDDAWVAWISDRVEVPAVKDFIDSTEPGEFSGLVFLDLDFMVRHDIQNGIMRLSLRFFSESGDYLTQSDVTFRGQSTGWHEGRLIREMRRIQAPPQVRFVEISLVSGGPYSVTGEIGLGELNINPLWAPGVETPEFAPVIAQSYGRVRPEMLHRQYNARQVPMMGPILYELEFSSAEFGTIPAGWRDLRVERPSRNWAVDTHGFLRYILFRNEGLIAYEGALTSGEDATGLENYAIAAGFKKTRDADVQLSLAGRIQNRDNYYRVGVLGDNRLVIEKVEDGASRRLTDIVLLERYNHPEEWRLTASFYDDLITGIVTNAHGRVVARADARDAIFPRGSFGVHATEFAAVSGVSCYAAGDVSLSRTMTRTLEENLQASPLYGGYDLTKLIEETDTIDVLFEDLRPEYDIVVAGAGTGGWAVAVQAARMGRSVLLLDETDWLGGQMGAAAVTSMDESGAQVRERGIYREFHESMILYYYGLDIGPYKAYWSYDHNPRGQFEGGFEPKRVEQLFYGFISEARKKAEAEGGVLDVIKRTRVTEVEKTGTRVDGVMIERWDPEGVSTRRIGSGILVDATEYGDVIPLTGAPYRVGNTRSDDLNLAGSVQAHSYNIVFREYPDGIPEHLRIRTPPPGYDQERRLFEHGTIYGDWELQSGQRMYRVLMAWRGFADSHGPMVGRQSEERHTLASTNYGNNYRVSVNTIESLDQRYHDERTGIYRTLGSLYYLQNELGVDWSFCDRHDYDTPYNRKMMEKRGISDEMMPFAVRLCQIPYVRESRRIIGVDTLVAGDLTRWEDAKHMPTSVVMGDYYMDLHGTYENIEHDLDTVDFTMGGGPFQAPFEVFIPRELDGFLPAEKNFSQSRLVSGATRLQPITMLTGQAVGVIAALAVAAEVQPRDVNPLAVQLALLDEGATLIQRWHSDVEWGTDLWRAVQLLSLYQIMDRPGPFTKQDGIKFNTSHAWGAELPVTANEIMEPLYKLAGLLGFEAAVLRDLGGADLPLTEAEFQRLAAQIAPGFAAHAMDLDSEKTILSASRFALFALSALRGDSDVPGSE